MAMTKREVDRLAQAFHDATLTYGPNNMVTQRAEIAYRFAVTKFSKQKAKRQERNQVMRDLGLTKVRGAVGGTYWE